MNLTSLGLLGQTTYQRFEWGRLQSLPDWMSVPLAWTLIVAATTLVLLLVVVLYRRDAVELRPWLGVLLAVLRIAALLGVLVLFLQPRYRTERELVQNSRVVLLVDTSQSMGLSDTDSSVSTPESTRSHQVAAALEKSDFVNRLRQTHDVIVMRFDETLSRIATLAKFVLHPESPDGSKQPEITTTAASEPSPPGEAIDWEKALRPLGRETRLGQAMRQVIGDQRGAPISGVVVITDGGQNAGPSPDSAMELAADAKMAMFPVGVGSTQRPANVRVYEFEAPERAHPGDPYTVTGLIQGEGMANQTVNVELALRDPNNKTAEQILETGRVALGRDGDTVAVKFQVTPTETGRRQLILRVKPPKPDRNPGDDQRETEIEVVDRKTKVLLFAGAASREYQFLKALLYRDKTTSVDVLLQTGFEGISQEANQVLDDFPSTREEMYAYDCVVAFDPDWQKLNAEQIDLLESWVGEQGGGLIVIPGPVYAGQPINGWIQARAADKIKNLYPVEFHRRVSVVDAAAYGSKDPWPLDFTREGREAEFLWLADTASESEQAWARFTGVFGYYPVKGAKPGATIYARFSDPQTGSGEKQPVYIAGQFYGSGRVVYLGSGEMWRLRRLDDSYFDRLYTRLVRHVSQGRSLRQSSRGSLIVDKARYTLGSTVQIRAQVTNAQLQPLESPGVPLEIYIEGGAAQTINLRPDPTRKGMYIGQFTALAEGAYRLELPVPESNNERLVRRIQVRLPDLEADNPQRNDPLLSRVAEASGGKYYNDLNLAFSIDSSDPLIDRLKDRTKTTILTSAPNPLDERRWLGWLMGIICGLLCIEWLIRRLVKLA